MPQTDLPLPVYYAQTLRSLLSIFDDSVSSSDPSAQTTLSSALDDLHLISRMVTSLGVFSNNETVEELGDGELVFMSLGWVIGEAESKGGLGGKQDRLGSLKRSETAYNLFLGLLSLYSVVGPEEQAESSAMGMDAGLPRDPAKRREAKIAQYKREKSLRDLISGQLPDHPDSSSNPLVFLISLLPDSPTSSNSATRSSEAASTSVNPEDKDLRDVSVSILRLLHVLTLSALSSIKMELDLLASAPDEPSDLAPPVPQGTDNTWRLDRPASNGKAQPRELISGGGRVLRPFTILPSTTALSDRERLRSEVFRSGHRLPTMTIDEYLEEEQRRGNIITGGGQASADAPTDSELLALAAEEDGTMEGDSKAEEKRLKEEKWAQYADENRKGSGNTMNRG